MHLKLFLVFSLHKNEKARIGLRTYCIILELIYVLTFHTSTSSSKSTCRLECNEQQNVLFRKWIESFAIEKEMKIPKLTSFTYIGMYLCTHISNVIRLVVYVFNWSETSRGQNTTFNVALRTYVFFSVLKTSKFCIKTDENITNTETNFFVFGILQSC